MPILATVLCVVLASTTQCRWVYCFRGSAKIKIKIKNNKKTLTTQHIHAHILTQLHTTQVTKSAAETAGFKAASTSCVPDVGIVYYDTTDGLPSVHKPLGLGFTPSGQLTSLTINIYGTGVPASLVTKGWCVGK